MKALSIALFLVGLFGLGACSSGGSSSGSGGFESGSSEPTNDAEKIKIQQALLRCIKTGGTRVVKIRGNYQCY